MTLKAVGAVVAVAAVVAGAALVWRFGYFAVPFTWTREPERLAAALGLTPGMTVADVGAGDGALAVAMAAVVGAAGRVHATELSAERRDAIARRIAVSGIQNVVVVAAAEAQTGLPDRCCDALYLRTVFHHVPDRAAFAAALTRVVRPGGRIAVIDFAPGTLWFHGADHGVAADAVTAAFARAGWVVCHGDDAWGGGMFLRVFARPGVVASGQCA